MRKVYLTSCVDCPGSDAGDAINDMVEQAVSITRRTFLTHVEVQSLREIELDLSYASHSGQGLMMAGDWHVSYFKSVFRGRACVFFDHSGIEHIFV